MPPRRTAARISATAVGGSLFVAALLASRPDDAAAYPWMVKHEYGSCGVCHLDPAGGSLLTPYGRAQSDLLLRTRYGHATEEDAWEVSPSAGFLWGAWDPPEGLLLSGSFRAMALVTGETGSEPRARAFPMQADLRAGLDIGPVKASASVGYARGAARPAQVTSGEEHNLISREHWLGVGAEDRTWLLRAGRLGVPFGVRQIEHTLWARSVTRTDLNEDHQHGLAFYLEGEDVRGEVMAILGNYQVAPDAFRERGGAGTIEWAPAVGHALGLSSVVARAERDVGTGAALLRQAHGLSYRGSPAKPVAALAEADVLLTSGAEEPTKPGLVTMAQVDVEPVQGLHAMLTTETLAPTFDVAMGLGAWASLVWFFAPHADFRLDGVVRSEGPSDAERRQSASVLAQLHVFL